MISSLLLALAASFPASPGGEPPLALENEHLRVEFSAQDGSIVRLRNRRAQVELISRTPSARLPWALLLAPLDLVSDFETFRIEPSGSGDDQRIALRWETRYRIAVEAEARLAKGSDELELFPREIVLLEAARVEG